MKIARNRTVARRSATMGILCAASLCLGAGAWAGSARAVWSEIPLPDGVAAVRAIEIGRVYVWIAATDGAGNDLGVYRSPLVAPDSWASLGFAGSGVHGFAVGGIADERVLIASWDDPPLYYSSDCGGTWVPRSGSMDGRLVTELAGTEAGSARVYAASRSSGGAAGWQGLSTSTDFGLTWSNWSYRENCVMNGIGWISVDHLARHPGGVERQPRNHRRRLGCGSDLSRGDRGQCSERGRSGPRPPRNRASGLPDVGRYLGRAPDGGEPAPGRELPPVSHRIRAADAGVVRDGPGTRTLDAGGTRCGFGGAGRSVLPAGPTDAAAAEPGADERCLRTHPSVP